MAKPSRTFMTPRVLWKRVTGLLVWTGISIRFSQAFYLQNCHRRGARRLVLFSLCSTTTWLADHECDQFAADFEDSLELSQYYRRDRRDNSTSSSMGDAHGLRTLLHRRYVARRERDFDTVGQIDQELRLRHGVRAYDVPPIWTTRLHDPPAAHVRHKAQKKHAQLQQLYGPTGHPYQYVGNHADALFCPLPTPTIHDLLSRRTRCRMEGRFEEADAIKFELWVHGLRILDDSNMWTVAYKHDAAKHLAFSTDKPADLDTTYVPQTHFDTSTEQGLRLQQRITQLIQMRNRAIACGDLSTANYIALELGATYQVIVNDKERTWRVCEGDDAPITMFVTEDATQHVAFPEVMFMDKEIRASDDTAEYKLSSNSKPLDAAVEDRVRYLVQERARKREEGKFLEADAIRKELWSTYVGCGVLDGVKCADTW